MEVKEMEVKETRLETRLRFVVPNFRQRHRQIMHRDIRPSLRIGDQNRIDVGGCVAS